jgi:hypothetical protein
MNPYVKILATPLGWPATDLGMQSLLHLFEVISCDVLLAARIVAT